MWLSTRKIRSLDDLEWADHLNSLGLHHLREVRSVDSWCNPHFDYSQNFRLHSLDEVWEMLNWLPTPIGQQYHLLFADPNNPEVILDHPRLKLLGYDLLSQAGQSSLLNYRPWIGVLAPLAQRMNQYGLLSWEDAQAAQAILPKAWSNHPCSKVKIWVLFECIQFVDDSQRPRSHSSSRQSGDRNYAKATKHYVAD